MFILFVVAGNAVVTMRNAKTTGITIIIVFMIVYFVEGFMWMVHPPMFDLTCLVPCLLWAILV